VYYEVVAVEERLGRRMDKLAEVITDVKTNHEQRLRTLEDEAGIDTKMLSI